MTEKSLDHTGEHALYKQLIGRITRDIQEGILKPGDPLPSKQDLAKSHGVDPKTVDKAFEELVKDKIIEVLPHKGAFVSQKQNVLEEGRKAQATAAIETCLKSLEALKFTYREMRHFFDLKISERLELFTDFYMAAVDCNPEALSIFKQQLGFLSRINITNILLDDLLGSGQKAEDRLQGFALIITTATHHKSLIKKAPTLSDKIIQVAVSPAKETIYELSQIGSGQRVGILCESRRFLEIVENKLADLKIPKAKTHYRLTGQKDSGESVFDFLAGTDLLLIPPMYAIHLDRATVNALERFTASGGKVVPYKHQIERDSLLYIEERINELLYN